ncbi:hypothetical protein SAMD00019534_020390 [Acytostelium subglobosum LB1]|uniref:hypothetical protein n=1 Tax=Acytostelium subglobosum LB1 TaxID=1410327 RepID=UPI000644CC8F|nr:hypothetical protein SAMD00019534_020390 [Acytostelium subglobosum LB1]GAM18864.1 hypothetical protein SAMD00019534_020390 [Acytostelium subglobosum LB1]|eukprot:XP_012758084.1 hypothetical protein SAMD00019534_020390 [Acytostelium subglobosum LB1]
MSDLNNFGINICGDAGIGKSTFFPYLLWALSQEDMKYTVIYHSIHYNGSIFFFHYDKDGKPILLTYRSINDIPLDLLSRESMLYFVDGFAPQPTIPCFTILVTSPAAKHLCEEFWKKPGDIIGNNLNKVWVKYLPKWSWEEISSLVQFMGHSDEKAKNRYLIWGGIVRHVLQQTAQDTLDQALSRVDALKILHAPLKEELTVSHKLIHYRVDDNYDLDGLEFASEYVKNSLLKSAVSRLKVSLVEFLQQPDVVKSSL